LELGAETPERKALSSSFNYETRDLYPRVLQVVGRYNELCSALILYVRIFFRYRLKRQISKNILEIVALEVTDLLL